jgi:hypothetical protein
MASVSKELRIGVLGGIIATAVMSALIQLSPLIGIARIPVWKILADLAGLPVIFGWFFHFSIGIILASLYIFFFRRRLPGGEVARAMIFSLIPFLLAQLVATATGGDLNPSNRLVAFLGSLVGHLVYGLALGYTIKIAKI